METISNKEKAEKLANAVANEVVAGWRVESQTTVQAVLIKGGAFNNGMHIFIDVLTCGLWLIVHVPLYLKNKRKTKILRIDDYGNILTTES